MKTVGDLQNDQNISFVLLKTIYYCVNNNRKNVFMNKYVVMSAAFFIRTTAASELNIDTELPSTYTSERVALGILRLKLEPLY